MGEYINIYGLLFAKTADGKLAFTGQIWDEELQKFQSDINKLTPQLGEDGKLPADLLPESLKNATSTEVVESLPQTGEANKIYLVKRESSDPVVYDASMWINGAWASFGGNGGGENNALVFDQKQTLTAEQQNQVLANAGLNIVKIPSALFGTVLSDEDFAAIQNATAIIPIDGDQAGFIFTKAIITPSTIDFFSFNTNFSFRRATLTISSKRLSTLAATDISDQVAVKYRNQILTPQEKSIARNNIGAIDSETVNGLLQVVAPTYVGVGGDDLSQYDIADDSPMYAFLVRLIAFMGTIDETSPVFWFYSEDNENSPTQQFGTVVAWSNEEMTFIAMRPDGSISEYQIVGGETGVPTALNRLRTANVFIPQGAVLFSQAQTLSIAQKTQARTNIGAADEEMLETLSQIFVMPMMEALVPMSAGTGGDDLSQYDLAENSDMYNFLVRLIKFQNTMGAELTNQVFWFYTLNSDPEDVGRVFSAVISWASTENGKKFTAIRANGDVAEYEITIDESGSEIVPTALTRLNHSNLFAAGTGAVLYDKAQTLQDSEKLQARENIGAVSKEEMLDWWASTSYSPILLPDGTFDLSLGDLREESPLYHVLRRIIDWCDTVDNRAPFQIRTQDNQGEYFLSVIGVGCSDYSFTVLSPNGMLTTYQIDVGNSYEINNLERISSTNIFKSTTSNTVKGVEVVQGTAPMQQDNILYIELEETT